jgi:hypothetical protein
MGKSRGIFCGSEPLMVLQVAVAAQLLMFDHAKESHVMSLAEL